MSIETKTGHYDCAECGARSECPPPWWCDACQSWSLPDNNTARSRA